MSQNYKLFWVTSTFAQLAEDAYGTSMMGGTDSKDDDNNNQRWRTRNSQWEAAWHSQTQTEGHTVVRKSTVIVPLHILLWIFSHTKSMMQSAIDNYKTLIRPRVWATSHHWCVKPSSSRLYNEFFFQFCPAPVCLFHPLPHSIFTSLSFSSALSVFLDTCAGLVFQPSPWKINAELQSLNPLGSAQPRHTTPLMPRRCERDCLLCVGVSELWLSKLKKTQQKKQRLLDALGDIFYKDWVCITLLVQVLYVSFTFLD